MENMEEEIKIELNNKYDFFDKYNENRIADEIIEYIMKQSVSTKRSNKIRIIIDKKCNIDKDIKKMINDKLKEEYDRSLKKNYENNIKQCLLLIIGVMCIFFSTLVNEDVIWGEILLISGWVPIWEVIEIQLFSDVEEKNKRKNITKLLNSEIIVKYSEIEKNI